MIDRPCSTRLQSRLARAPCDAEKSGFFSFLWRSYNVYRGVLSAARCYAGDWWACAKVIGMLVFDEHRTNASKPLLTSIVANASSSTPSRQWQKLVQKSLSDVFNGMSISGMGHSEYNGLYTKTDHVAAVCNGYPVYQKGPNGPVLFHGEEAWMVSSCPQCHLEPTLGSYCRGQCERGCDGLDRDIMLLGGCIATPDEAQEGRCVSDWAERTMPCKRCMHNFGINSAVRVQAVAKCVDKPNGPKYCSSWCNTPGVWGCGLAFDDGRGYLHSHYWCDCAGCNGCP